MLKRGFWENLVGESPKNKFLIFDAHISVAADIKDIMGESRFIEWCLSSHTWVFNKKPKRLKHINKRNWKLFDEEAMESFHNEYGDYLRKFDGFFVGYALGFALLFERYNKPIYAWNACRYDVPFCQTKNVKMWDILNASLRRMHSNGQLVIACNNLADLDYLKFGTGIEGDLVPSLCAYPKQKHNPKLNTFYWYPQHVTPPKHALISPRGRNFVWSDIVQHSGIINVPYEISTMSFFEQYQTGLPIFFPSKDLLRDIWKNGGQWQSMSAFWADDYPLKESHGLDIDFWLDRADFYNPQVMPYLYYFNSFEDLKLQIEGFEDVYKSQRLEFINNRSKFIRNYWQEKFNVEKKKK